MRKVLVAALVALLCCGCGSVRNGWTQFRQQVTMLDCTITLYAQGGAVIREWHTRAMVQSSGGEAWWVGDDGVQYHISGTFIVSGR